MILFVIMVSCLTGWAGGIVLGIWGQCYMMDFQGKQICDGPRPAQLPGEECPSNFTPDFGAPHA